MESHIICSCPGKLRATEQFAREQNCFEQFARGWMQLMSVLSSFDPGENAQGLILVGEVWADWAEHSFAWGVKRIHRDEPITAGTYLMVGGLIHHGPKDTGAGGPENFTASLGRVLSGAASFSGTARDRVPHEWTIHT